MAPPVLTATPDGADVVVEPPVVEPLVVEPLVVEPLVVEPLVGDVALDADSEDLLDAEVPDASELDADEEVFALDAEELVDDDALLDEESDDPVSAHAVP